MLYRVLSFERLAFLKCILFLLLVKTQVLKCHADCKLLNSTEKEIQLLNRIKPLNGYTFEAKDLYKPENYSYKISICDKMKGQDDGVGAVQYSKNHSFILGRYNKTEITGGNNWVLLTYYGGKVYASHCNNSERITKIMILCDPDVFNGKMEIIEERNSSPQSCYYLFEIGSNITCSYTYEPMTPHKYSSGTVFCILFFTFASLYLVIGFLYKRLIVGAQGLEQIPNYSFWKELGNLQADGCDYICRCGSRHESQAYRGIDDILKTEDERDDQLLN